MLLRSFSTRPRLRTLMRSLGLRLWVAAALSLLLLPNVADARSGKKRRRSRTAAADVQGEARPKKDGTKKGTQKKGTQKNGTQKNGTQKNGTQKKDAPKKGAQKKDAPKKDAPKKLDENEIDREALLRVLSGAHDHDHDPDEENVGDEEIISTESESAADDPLPTGSGEDAEVEVDVVVDPAAAEGAPAGDTDAPSAHEAQVEGAEAGALGADEANLTAEDVTGEEVEVEIEVEGEATDAEPGDTVEPDDAEDDKPTMGPDADLEGVPVTFLSYAAWAGLGLGGLTAVGAAVALTFPGVDLTLPGWGAMGAASVILIASGAAMALDHFYLAPALHEAELAENAASEKKDVLDPTQEGAPSDADEDGEQPTPPAMTRVFGPTSHAGVSE